MVSIQVGANTRINTGWFAARSFNLFILASKAIHIGCGAAQIGDMTGKSRRSITDGFDFPNDGTPERL